MTEPHSPVIDFYPKEFEEDLNGKQQAWEAVVLIPFIDEVRLTIKTKLVSCVTVLKTKWRLFDSIHVQSISKQLLQSGADLEGGTRRTPPGSA